MAMLRTLISRLSQFRGAEAGVAAVEFALILPIMLFTYVGMVEASALISMDRKVQMVSGAVGDLVARQEDQITASQLTDYVRAAGGIMTPYDAGPLVQIVTQVLVQPDGTTSVDWSCSYVHQVAERCRSGEHASGGSTYELPDDILTISRGEYVIVAESSYSYRPLYGIVFNQAIDLYRENFYLPRFGERIVYRP